MLQEKGTDKFPTAAFSLWRLVKDALLKVKVKEQLSECEQAFANAQEAERNGSLKGEKEEVEVPCKEHIRIFVKDLMDEEEDNLASVSDLVEEEEQLQKEIEELQQKLRPAKVKAQSAPSEPLLSRPQPRNPHWIGEEKESEDRYRQKKGCVCGMKHIQSLKLRIKLDRWSRSMFL